MPVIESNSVLDWGMQAIAHMRNAHKPGDPPCQVDWGFDPGNLDVSLVCPACNVWFNIPRAALQQPDQSTRIVSDFLRSAFGRSRLLEYLRTKGAEGLKPGEHPFDPDAPIEPVEEPRDTAWSKILEDDDYE